jgi:transposase
MSMQPQIIPPVPLDTEAVARAAFPKGNIYVLLRDNLGGEVTKSLSANSEND